MMQETVALFPTSRTSETPQPVTCKLLGGAEIPWLQETKTARDAQPQPSHPFRTVYLARRRARILAREHGQP